MLRRPHPGQNNVSFAEISSPGNWSGLKLSNVQKITVSKNVDRRKMFYVRYGSKYIIPIAMSTTESQQVLVKSISTTCYLLINYRILKI